MKKVECTICHGPHYKSFCFRAPRAAIATKPANYSTLSPKALRKPTNKAKVHSSRRKDAVETLDRVFSVYVRQSAAVDGLARCVTCGDWDRWQDMDNGHFLVRGKVGTRWDERNCHPQCRYDNQVLGGAVDSYEGYLVRTYGPDILEELRLQSRQLVPTIEIEAKVAYYQAQLLLIQ